MTSDEPRHRDGAADLDRRGFHRLAAAGVGVLGGLLSGARSASAGSSTEGGAQPARKPPVLRPGDVVGLVLPASLEFEPSRIDLARRQLEAVGFRVRLGRHVRERHGSLAGSDRERADDFNEMFADDEVRGVVCHRGGWGTPRILPLLDYDAIRAHPKVVVGFSDVTALINAIHKETGLVTFHGPNGATPLRPYTLQSFRRVVMSTDAIGVLANPPKGEDELVNRSFPVLTHVGGRATGPLVGGNLTLLASTMGTPWEVETRGRILLLEDVREELYRVDRMLTQLSLGGKFDGLAGVAFGGCSDCPPGQGPSFSLEQLIDHHFGSLGVPVASGVAFGHIRKMMTLPIGLDATFDADAGTFTFVQAAVR